MAKGWQHCDQFIQTIRSTLCLPESNAASQTLTHQSQCQPRPKKYVMRDGKKQPIVAETMGEGLDHIAVNINLTPISLLLPGFSEHKLSHPVNALVARLDGEMVSLCRGGAKDALFLGCGHELETKG